MCCVAQTTRSDDLLAPLPSAKCLNGKGTANPPPFVLRTWGERDPMSNETAFAMLPEGPEQERQADYILTQMQVRRLEISPFSRRLGVSRVEPTTPNTTPRCRAWSNAPFQERGISVTAVSSRGLGRVVRLRCRRRACCWCTPTARFWTQTRPSRWWRWRMARC